MKPCNAGHSHFGSRWGVWFAAIVGTSVFFLALIPVVHAAQKFPSKPVTIIVPQAPGGANDAIARSIAQKLQEFWEYPVVVEFRPGGGAVVATLAIARSTPDGHTIGLISTAHSINASIRKDLPYDTVRDLAPVARINVAVMALVAISSVPANNVSDLVALAKQKPGELQYGSNGIGTAGNLAGELFNSMAAVDLQHIPYKGGAQLYQDMLGGRVQLAFAVLSSAMQHVKVGRMKVLAITNATRSQMYPKYPTVAETLPGYEITNWGGFVVSGRTPKDLLQRISDDVLKVIRSPEVRKKLIELEVEPADLPSEEFDAFIRTEIDRLGKIIRRSGAKLD